MKRFAYKAFNITVYANQNAADGLWISDVRIFSSSGELQTLDDVPFETRDEAEQHGVEIAKSWVNRQRDTDRS